MVTFHTCFLRLWSLVSSVVWLEWMASGGSLAKQRPVNSWETLAGRPGQRNKQLHWTMLPWCWPILHNKQNLWFLSGCLSSLTWLPTMQCWWQRSRCCESVTSCSCRGQRKIFIIKCESESWFSFLDWQWHKSVLSFLRIFLNHTLENLYLLIRYGLIKW